MTTLQELERQLIADSGLEVISETVETGQWSTNYFETGNGEPIVFIHGLVGGGISWLPVVCGLSFECRSVLPDILGCGRSDKPNMEYSIDTFSEWLREFLNALGIAKATLVGISLGGAIATQFAHDKPDRVDKLVLVDPACFGRETFRRAAFGFAWLFKHPSKASLYWMQRCAFRKPHTIPKTLADHTLQVLKSPGGTTVFRNIKWQVFRSRFLEEIKTETLIVWGEKDTVIPKGHGTRARRLLSNSSLVVMKDVGHVPFVDDTSGFNEMLNGFLEGDRHFGI